MFRPAEPRLERVRPPAGEQVRGGGSHHLDHADNPEPSTNKGGVCSATIWTAVDTLVTLLSQHFSILQSAPTLLVVTTVIRINMTSHKWLEDNVICGHIAKSLH